jgi:hypothetical protein
MVLRCCTIIITVVIPVAVIVSLLQRFREAVEARQRRWTP